jgi:outer membrane protein TolC
LEGAKGEVTSAVDQARSKLEEARGRVSGAKQRVLDQVSDRLAEIGGAAAPRH